MRMCMPHWNALRDAIRVRGLDGLTASSGEDVVERMKSGGFDPLMGAHNLVVGRCLEVYGPGITLGDSCPLCQIEHDPAKCREPDCSWIQGAADDALREAVRLGLVSGDVRVARARGEETKP